MPRPSPLLLSLVSWGALMAAERDPWTYVRLGPWLVTPEGNLAEGTWRLHPKAVVSAQASHADGGDGNQALTLLAGAELRWRPTEVDRAQMEALGGFDASTGERVRPRGHGSIAWERGAQIWTFRLGLEGDRDALTQEVAPAAPERSAGGGRLSASWTGARTRVTALGRMSGERVHDDTFWLSSEAASFQEEGGSLTVDRSLGSHLEVGTTAEVVHRVPMVTDPLPVTTRTLGAGTLTWRPGDRTSLRLLGGARAWQAQAPHSSDPTDQTRFLRPEVDVTLTWDYRDPNEGYCRLRLWADSLPAQGAAVADRRAMEARWWHALPRRFGLLVEGSLARLQDLTPGQDRPKEVFLRTVGQVAVFYLPSYGWRAWVGLWHSDEQARIAPASPSTVLSLNTAVVF